jgi:hypothetical protein
MRARGKREVWGLDQSRLFPPGTDRNVRAARATGIPAGERRLKPALLFSALYRLRIDAVSCVAS